MGNKATKSPGATPKATTRAADPPAITGLRYVGPGYLAALGTRDHSVASLTVKGAGVYARAVASGWYVPTADPIHDRGLPPLPAAPDAPPTPDQEAV
jgi:hypothetical protein